MSTRPRVFLIDGNAFCYRAFYAVRPLTTSSGEPTQAVFGVVSMLKKILEEAKPTHLAFCFDLGEPTFRHLRYKAYKATRKPMPDDLVRQMPRVKEVLRAYRIPIFEQAGFEADDLLGTLAERLARKDFDVFIATSDKDALQLVTERVKIYSAHQDGLILDRDKVKERFGGLGPERVTDVLALAGDSSDNIPGLPGVGEKTAVELIRRFGSLEKLISRAGELESPARAKALREHKEKLAEWKELVTIRTDVPIDLDVDALKRSEPDTRELSRLFAELEFRKFLIDLGPEQKQDPTDRRYELVSGERDVREFASKLGAAPAFAVLTHRAEGDARRARLVGMSFAVKPRQAFYVPCDAAAIRAIRPALENERIEKWGHALKDDLHALRRAGVQLAGPLFDCSIASYLANPARGGHTLEDVAFERLSIKKMGVSEVVGSGKEKVGLDQVPASGLRDFACEEADLVARLKPLLAKRLAEFSLAKLFTDLEMPLTRVLARMEWEGVRVDREILETLGRQCRHELDELAGRIYREAGEEFNINSTKQLADILFTKLRLPVVKRTKTGYSTDVAVLEKLAESHELPRLILDYRERAKLQSTYLEAIPQLIDSETGRLHTSFNQTVTATGRLSSSDPNLQNIPIRSKLGREIRRAFVPRAKARKLLAADYSQVELRLLAHLSGDPVLTTAFREDRDIHAHTACVLYGVQEKDVTREMRDAAKTVNFSVLYGKTAFGLARDLGISVGDAADFIKAYFKRYGRVESFLGEKLEQARRDGYVTTMLGRRAYVPDIKHPNATVRGFAERAAMNAPLQGSAADLIKLAMVAIDAELEKKYPQAHMILQVHDELVFDVPDPEVDAVSGLVKDKMETAMVLDVPLRVDVHVGDSWYKD